MGHHLSINYFTQHRLSLLPMRQQKIINAISFEIFIVSCSKQNI